MPLSVSHAEPKSIESQSSGLNARNSHTPNFLSDGIVARMPFLDAAATHAVETCDTDGPHSMSTASQHGLAARMRTLIRAEGSMASIARRCGFSEGAVRSWRDGQSDISRERCVVMARTLNVSLIWLITGEGSMRPDSAMGESTPGSAQEHAASPTPQAVHHQQNDHTHAARTAVDSRVLAAALRLLQSYVGLLGGSLNPMQRADVLAELYDILRRADEPGYIDRLIAFHTTLSNQMRRGGSLVA